MFVLGLEASANATPELTNPNNLAVSYSSSNPNVATVDAQGNVTILALGQTIITASSAATDKYYEGKASYTISVGPKEGEILDVATSIAAINNGFEGTLTTKGIVSRVTYFNSNYGSVTYYISDNGSTTGDLQVYGGLGLDGKQFTSKDDVEVGATVVVNGKVKLYNGAPEFDTNSVMLEYTPVVEPEPAYSVTFNFTGVEDA